MNSADAETAPDYSDHVEAPSEDKLQVLTQLAEHQQQIESQIETLEQQLKQLGVQHRELAWDQIPRLMGELRMSLFQLENGFTIDVQEKLRVSIPKDEEKHQIAMAWIDDHGGSALVRRGFNILFDKSQEKFARKFKRDCEQRKNALPMEEILTIHSGTLTKFLSDKLAAGEAVPLKAFGAHLQRIAKIKAPRKQRARR